MNLFCVQKAVLPTRIVFSYKRIDGEWENPFIDIKPASFLTCMLARVIKLNIYISILVPYGKENWFEGFIAYTVEC